MIFACAASQTKHIRPWGVYSDEIAGPGMIMDWDLLDEGKYRDEAATGADLLARTPLSAEERAQAHEEALALVRGARKAANRQGVVEGFLQEFSLGTREGLALMCLAEALLRIHDQGTRDALIAEKI